MPEPPKILKCENYGLIGQSMSLYWPKPLLPDAADALVSESGRAFLRSGRAAKQIKAPLTMVL